MTALIAYGPIVFLALLALVAWVLDRFRSTPSIAEMVDQAPDSDDPDRSRQLESGGSWFCAQCCADAGAPHLEWCTYGGDALDVAESVGVVAGFRSGLAARRRTVPAGLRRLPLRVPTSGGGVVMAGAYCRYCNRRCFVYRQVIVGGEFVWGGHMATCEHGKRHDRAVLGQDADTAHNPFAEESRAVKP